MFPKSKLEKQNKVKAPKRSKKFQYGDHIPRSEYDDGVLRNNHRCTNRLSYEMQMYEKAHRVIMKDIGKESQMLKAKMSSTFLVSPRFDIADTPSPSSPYRMTNPFATSSGIPFVRMDSKLNHKLKPLYQLSPIKNNEKAMSVIGKRRTIPSGHKFSESYFNAIQKQDDQIQKDKSEKTVIGKIKPRREVEEKRKVESRTGSVARKADSRAESVKNTARKSESRAESVNTNKLPLRSDSEMSIIAMVNETNRDGGRSSKLDGRTSKLSDVRIPSRFSTKGSRTSLIDVLKEAEERKAREKETHIRMHTLPVGTNQHRPRTPKPMSNYDDDGNDDVFDEDDPQEKTGLHKATPNATYVNIPT